MAFVKANWSGDGNNYNLNIPREHKYNSGDDNAAAVTTAGYFDAVAPELQVGDRIYALVDGDPVHLSVTVITDGVVTVAEIPAAE